MRKKEGRVFARRVPMIILFAIGFMSLACIGCGADEAEERGGTERLTTEEQKDLTRFIEYVLFPSSPYIDKSWVETDVPEDEVAEKRIDFETETAAIQQVYTEVYNAWEARDFETVAAHFYPSTIRFVFICSGGELAEGFARRVLSKTSIRNPYNVCNGGFFKLSSTPELTDFYIRRANVQTLWPEASAKTADKTYLYLIKWGDTWYMNELVVTDNHSYTDKGDTRKYFDDPKYKAPE